MACFSRARTSCCAPARRVHSVADRLHGPVQPASRAYKSRLTALTPPSQISPSRSPSSALGRPARPASSFRRRSSPSFARTSRRPYRRLGRKVRRNGGKNRRPSPPCRPAPRAAGVNRSRRPRSSVPSRSGSTTPPMQVRPSTCRRGCESDASQRRHTSAAPRRRPGTALARPSLPGVRAAMVEMPQDKAGEVEFHGTAPGQLLQDAANPWLQAGACVRAVGLGAPSGAGGSVNRRGTWEGWSIAVLLTPPSHGPRADRK